VTATEANGQQVTVMESGGCVEVKGMGQDQRLCRGEIGSMLANSPMPAAERVAVQHVMSGFQKLGIMTSESGGQWYVNPLRTMLDIGPALLSGLTRSDFQHLIQLGR
jgi:hypothetical protein